MIRTSNRSARTLPALLVGFLTACGGGDAAKDGAPGDAPKDVAPDDVVVFQSRQSVLCGSRGLTPEQGSQKLVNAGIDVVRSGCGVMTGVAFPAVCGGETGEILLHEIRSVNLADAQRLGLESASTLVNTADGTGYVWVDCQTGQTLK